MPRWLVVAFLATPAVARAEPERTAADVANAPLPGHESGRTDPLDDGDTDARAVARAALAVPRLGIEAVLTPVRDGLELYDRYDVESGAGIQTSSGPMHLGFTANAAYVDDVRTAGLIGGGRLTAHDMFGEHEDAALQAVAGAGYYFSQLYAATVRSGERFGDRFALALDGGYEVRPRDAFYGIGNTSSPAMRYSQDRARIAASGDVRVMRELHVRPSVAFADHSLGADAPASWMNSSSAYGELALRWDSRHPAGEWDLHWEMTGGTLASAYAGRVHELAGGRDFWRYGFDVAQLVPLGVGPRVLTFALHGEAVTGSLDEVPVVELPSLGGLYLRGYALDRFRDRVAATATVEYRWDLTEWIAAHAFVDSGRVYGALDELTATGMRTGYGVGLDVGRNSMRIDVASSVDGGLYLAVALNPVADLDARARQR